VKTHQEKQDLIVSDCRYHCYQSTRPSGLVLGQTESAQFSSESFQLVWYGASRVFSAIAVFLLFFHSFYCRKCSIGLYRRTGLLWTVTQTDSDAPIHFNL